MASNRPGLHSFPRTRIAAEVLEIILALAPAASIFRGSTSKPEHGKPRPMKRRQQRQPDIAQADDADAGTVVFDLC